LTNGMRIYHSTVEELVHFAVEDKVQVKMDHNTYVAQTRIPLKVSAAMRKHSWNMRSSYTGLECPVGP